jgi:hypothetical protein
LRGVEAAGFGGFDRGAYLCIGRLRIGRGNERRQRGCE